ncbi:hypothetical protein [Chitinophaga varians]|uniref:hypothetical protein n=1 Tax=Chitinophaga varians TaxID=2202339 RepID=UPI00165EF410|nr:hypothetical protein [Chitinophaga varians]MBC9910531.1 hypothetical protein [Chitinophaga varians]
MPLRLVLLLFVYLLIIGGCRFQPVNTVEGKLVLIDSSLPADKAKLYNGDDYSTAFPVYYMGPVADTIVLPSSPLRSHRKSGDEEFGEHAPWTPADSTHLQIVVDTAYRLSNASRYSHAYWSAKTGTYTEVLDSVVYYKAIPVFLYNKGNGVFNIGIFGELSRIILQAKNEKGDWQDIVGPRRYRCGTGASDQVLKGGEVAVAKLFLIDGDYHTSCRLKFKSRKDTVYSNVFSFTIEKRLLEKD